MPQVMHAAGCAKACTETHRAAAGGNDPAVQVITPWLFISTVGSPHLDRMANPRKGLTVVLSIDRSVKHPTLSIASGRGTQEWIVPEATRTFAL